MSPAPQNPFILPGDVFFTRSSSMLGRLIRWAETDPGEEETWANHTGLFVSAGYLWPGHSKMLAMCVESLWQTKHWTWWEGHKNEPGNTIRIYRYIGLRPGDARAIVSRAKSFVGDRYGWWKLGAHLIDRVLFKGKKTTSNLLRVDSRPICSYTAAKSLADGGVFFGTMAPEAADPDEMMDWCSHAQDQWFLVGEFTVPKEVKQ